MNKIKLEKGIIYLLLPFRINPESSLPAILSSNVWTKTVDKNPGLEFLLEPTRDFFSKNIRQDNIDETACLILQPEKNALPFKMFNNKGFWLSRKAFDQQTEKETKLIRLPVYLDPGSFKLIFHPYTSIAILIFSIELINQDKNVIPTLEDFIKLNYLIRVFNRQDEAFLISINERDEERRKAELLNQAGNNSLYKAQDKGDPKTKGWRPGQLINYLLSEINEKNEIQFFNPNHIVPYSYFQPSDEITDESIIHKALFYLRNVYDFDYMPPHGILESEEDFLHPYKQIYYASSIEGGVIFNNAGQTDPEFIKTFYSGSFKNSLWVAILGLMQRTIFLQLMKEVYDVDPDDHQKIKDYLRRYASISLKALFSKISVYHQHNDFYDLIIKKLQINELQKELKDELNELNNLQRQFHEDEVERHEEEEKHYEKRLNVILFALSVFSLTEVTYAFLQSMSLPFLYHLLAIGIPILLVVVFWQFLRFRKK